MTFWSGREQSSVDNNQEQPLPGPSGGRAGPGRAEGDSRRRECAASGRGLCGLRTCVCQSSREDSLQVCAFNFMQILPQRKKSK